MSKGKRKLTPAEKAAKRRRRQEYEMVFINGKQKWVRRPPTIDGLPVDEFIRRNADPIWLLQNEMYEELHEWQHNQNRLAERSPKEEPAVDVFRTVHPDEELPF